MESYKLENKIKIAVVGLRIPKDPFVDIAFYKLIKSLLVYPVFDITTYYTLGICSKVINNCLAFNNPITIYTPKEISIDKRMARQLGAYTSKLTWVTEKKLADIFKDNDKIIVLGVRKNSELARIINYYQYDLSKTIYVPQELEANPDCQSKTGLNIGSFETNLKTYSDAERLTKYLFKH